MSHRAATAGSPWIDDIEARSNLTRSQFLIWLGQKLDPGAPLYNMILAYRLRESMDRGAFENAFRALVARSDVLRTVVREIDGIPRQHVLDRVDDGVEFLDLSVRDDPQATYRQWLEERRTRVLALERCLFDCALVKLGENDYVWYWNQHHLVSDAWSASLICARLAGMYRQVLCDGRVSGSPLPDFASYVATERAARDDAKHDRARRHWRDTLARARDTTSFYDLNRVAQKARFWMPDNTWTRGQVTCRTNVNIGTSWG